MTDEAPICSRCDRVLSAEKPIRVPDCRVYCKSCCESMAADDFEMETGESFSNWIEKHPELVMKYQPLELQVRRMSFYFPLGISILGLVVLIYGIARAVSAYSVSMDFVAVLRGHFGYVLLGLVMVLAFGAVSLRGLISYLRANNFRMTLKDGVFNLEHGSRKETFNVDEVTQACVVRPGTVGATEGALQLKDGRMLTLDTCLSDLHALRVIMDLRFRKEFPPSADELAKIRRDKLRKIRGLAD